MQYMLLCYSDEKAWDAIPDAERMEIMRCLDGIREELTRGRKLLGSGRLEPIAATTTVRERQGKWQVTDGPFAETKEQLGGFYLVECETADEAAEIAGRLAAARPAGLFEVRPLRPTPYA